MMRSHAVALVTLASAFAAAGAHRTPNGMRAPHYAGRCDAGRFPPDSGFNREQCHKLSVPPDRGDAHEHGRCRGHRQDLRQCGLRASGLPNLGEPVPKTKSEHHQDPPVRCGRRGNTHSHHAKPRGCRHPLSIRCCAREARRLSASVGQRVDHRGEDDDHAPPDATEVAASEREAGRVMAGNSPRALKLVRVLGAQRAPVGRPPPAPVGPPSVTDREPSGTTDPRLAADSAVSHIGRSLNASHGYRPIRASWSYRCPERL